MNKTIAINPELFKLSTTQKKQSKANSRTMKNKPIISSNVLKNKLLKRIQKYKFNESKAQQKPTLKTKIDNKKDSKPTFSDEFSESLDFLKSLEKSKPINSQLSHHNVTMKHMRPNESISSIAQDLVNIDLPTELIETKFEINNNDVIGQPIHLEHNNQKENIVQITTDSLNKIPTMHLNKPSNDVPYGILKNGRKPTYRQWTQTQKNFKSISATPTLVPDAEMNDREKKLSELRSKLKSTNMNKDFIKKDWENENYIVNPNKRKESTEGDKGIDITEIKDNVSNFLIQKEKEITENNDKVDPIMNLNNNKRDPTKHYNKVTKIHRKYTLGKSKIKNKVSMLVKNNATRKKVLDAHKNLKKTSLHEIKQYLKEHNLIKIGSQSPNYILRKIYENAKLSGEISNVNKKTLLDNILSEYNDSII